MKYDTAAAAPRSYVLAISIPLIWEGYYKSNLSCYLRWLKPEEEISSFVQIEQHIIQKYMGLLRFKYISKLVSWHFLRLVQANVVKLEPYDLMQSRPLDKESSVGVFDLYDDIERLKCLGCSNVWCLLNFSLRKENRLELSNYNYARHMAALSALETYFDADLLELLLEFTF